MERREPPSTPRLDRRNLTLYLETAKDGYQAGGQDLEIDPPENFPTLLRELAACVRGEKAPDYSLEHDLAVQKALFAGCGITDGNALE